MAMPGPRACSLRPIIPLSFPSNLLPPVTPVHESSSSNEKGTKTNPSSSTMTITPTGLPPNIVKVAVFHRFFEVWRIFVQPDGRCVDVILAAQRMHTTWPRMTTSPYGLFLLQPGQLHQGRACPTQDPHCGRRMRRVRICNAACCQCAG
jgi:hypothetical protein